MKLDYGVFDDAFRNVVVTAATLQAIMPDCGISRARIYAAPLAEAMRSWTINTPRRAAGFLANVAHESGNLRYVSEIASGAVYNDRKDLGNTRPEAIGIAAQHGSTPGPWWKGHGLIQITGYDNHLACGQALGLDLLNAPWILEEPINAALSAAWFWHTHRLSEYMDAGDFRGACALINTGRPDTPPSRINGWDERLAFFHRACEALDC